MSHWLFATIDIEYKTDQSEPDFWIIQKHCAGEVWKQLVTRQLTCRVHSCFAVFSKDVRQWIGVEPFTTLSCVHQSLERPSVHPCPPWGSSSPDLSGSRSSSELHVLCCLLCMNILRRVWVLRSSRSKESHEKRLSSLTTLEGRLRWASLAPVPWRSCCRSSGNTGADEEGDEWLSLGRSRLRENLPLRFSIPFRLLTASVRKVGLSSDAGR